MNDLIIPSITPTNQVMTYKQLMDLQVQGMAQQLSDRMFYISLFLLFYVLMNMYVFKEGARLRAKFDKLCDETKYSLPGGTLGGWIFELSEDFALMGVLMLVILNVVYRAGVNL